MEHTTRHFYFEDTVLDLTAFADKAAACISRYCPGEAGELSRPCTMQSAMSSFYTWHNCPFSAAAFAQNPGLLATTEISAVGTLAAAENQSKLPLECMGHTDAHGPTIRDTVVHI